MGVTSLQKYAQNYLKSRGLEMQFKLVNFKHFEHFAIAECFLKSRTLFVKQMELICLG